MISLVKTSNTIGWPAYLHYWQKFAARYFNQLCHQGDIELPDVVAPPDTDRLNQLLLELPPMIGAEHCSTEVLKNIWNEFDRVVREKITSEKGGLSEFIRNHLPRWHQIVRICFHLAENKKILTFPLLQLMVATWDLVIA